jgi:hypothetical protein
MPFNTIRLWKLLVCANIDQWISRANVSQWIVSSASCTLSSSYLTIFRDVIQMSELWMALWIAVVTSSALLLQIQLLTFSQDSPSFPPLLGEARKDDSDSDIEDIEPA